MLQVLLFLVQNDLGNATYNTEGHQWDNNIVVNNSTVTSGSLSKRAIQMQIVVILATLLSQVTMVMVHQV